MSKARRSQSFKSSSMTAGPPATLGPLTPTAGPPSVALQLSSASEHKMNRNPTTGGATAMLARVASSPTTPRVSTTTTSAMAMTMTTAPSSPSDGRSSRQGSCSSGGTDSDESEKALSCFREAIMRRERGDQYFSFPDFDRFRRKVNEGDGSVPAAVK
ncbi:MAG: hypothetical protein M1816_005189 [Peltula sp. TS41687]|nr:MAG: hypothetical protein M1816_005189 [Peltula sp. TS41687]